MGEPSMKTNGGIDDWVVRKRKGDEDGSKLTVNKKARVFKALENEDKHIELSRKNVAERKKRKSNGLLKYTMSGVMVI